MDVNFRNLNDMTSGDLHSRTDCNIINQQPRWIHGYKHELPLIHSFGQEIQPEKELGSVDPSISTWEEGTGDIPIRENTGFGIEELASWKNTRLFDLLTEGAPAGPQNNTTGMNADLSLDGHGINPSSSQGFQCDHFPNYRASLDLNLLPSIPADTFSTRTMDLFPGTRGPLGGESENLFQIGKPNQTPAMVADCALQLPTTLASDTTAIGKNKEQVDQKDDVVEMMKTSQQKPKRKKHRPKVIVEGKKRKLSKPATSKRKYTQKNNLDTHSSAAVIEGSGDLLDIRPNTPTPSRNNINVGKVLRTSQVKFVVGTAKRGNVKDNMLGSAAPVEQPVFKRCVRKNSLSMDQSASAATAFYYQNPPEQGNTCAKESEAFGYMQKNLSSNKQYENTRNVVGDFTDSYSTLSYNANNYHLKESLLPVPDSNGGAVATETPVSKKFCRRVLTFDGEQFDENPARVTPLVGTCPSLCTHHHNRTVLQNPYMNISNGFYYGSNQLPNHCNQYHELQRQSTSYLQNSNYWAAWNANSIIPCSMTNQVPPRNVWLFNSYQPVFMASRLVQPENVNNPIHGSSSCAAKQASRTGCACDFSSWVKVPAFCKKKRTKMHKSMASNTVYGSKNVIRFRRMSLEADRNGYSCAERACHWTCTSHKYSRHAYANIMAEKGHSREEIFGWLVNRKKIPTRRRSFYHVRPRNPKSWTEIVTGTSTNCKGSSLPCQSKMQQLGASDVAHGGTTLSLTTNMNGMKIPKIKFITSGNRSSEQSCKQIILYNEKKISPKGGGNEKAKWRNMFHSMIKKFKYLGISDEEKALIQYSTRKKKQKSMVLYKPDGTIVPFDASLESVKQRKLRAKVYLDEETNRVWKLLMDSSDSQFPDATNEEKEKWWEHEREVFCGRANSFIARMRLVQGDRRFSPWKGSVVDSVIGVFLTQNVSDHLSSSAFMSLAARFPPKKVGNVKTCEETSSVATKMQIVKVLEPDDDKWIETSNESLCEQKIIMADVTDIEEIETVSSNDSPATCSGLCCSDILVNEKNVLGDSTSYQNSVVSSQDSITYPECQVAEKNHPVTHNAELDLLKDRSVCSSSSCTFTELLQKVTSANLNQFYDQSHMTRLAGEPEVDGTPDINLGSAGLSLGMPVASSSNHLHHTSISSISEESGSPVACFRSIEYLDNKNSENIGVLNLFENSVVSTTRVPEADEKAMGLENVAKGNIVDCVHSESKDKGETEATRITKSRRVGNDTRDDVDWSVLRQMAEAVGGKRDRTINSADSLDWETVRCADVSEIAYTIRERGMNNRLAERIKDFLNRLVDEQGSIDLEWLRDLPPDKAKEYLLSIKGLGLKSVECVRLLTLHHLAFPVDTNVGRIAVRLGWVPLQPLPESLQLHLLELYPVQESIQKYLWPRLCNLEQRTLYELHYQMITFGKVFCTKSKPNCNACPMRGECRHFASAFASARLALPAPERKDLVCVQESNTIINTTVMIKQPLLSLPHATELSEDNHEYQMLEPRANVSSCVPIIEEPSSPEPQSSPVAETDIEDLFCDDPDEIPVIKLNIEAFTQNLQHYMAENMEIEESVMSKALVTLNAEAASIPIPKLKNINRLRTEHHVYELPDSHPLLRELDKREIDDPCSYLLAIWTPGETASSIQPPETMCSMQENGKLCEEEMCFSCNSIRESESHIVRGTLLIPCRTAMRGSFPLNGTYFQVNEVFADHDTSMNPINVPRAWIWKLRRRTVYFGTSIPTIFKGLTMEGIQHCFWRGYVCVRGFDRRSRAPRPLVARLHLPPSKVTKHKSKQENQEA